MQSKQGIAIKATQINSIPLEPQLEKQPLTLRTLSGCVMTAKAFANDSAPDCVKRIPVK